MGKTNAQEREALAKIEEILEDFDPKNTYIGKAFEGCVEQARANIVNGGLESWKGWYLDEQLKNCRLSDRLADLSRQLNYKDDAIARLEDAKNQLSEEIDRLNGVAGAACKDLRREAEICDLRQTILVLKAKLYDMMTAREGVKE